MKKVMILLLLISFQVQASFTGSYSGTGRAVFASGRGHECTEIFLRLETTTDLFRLRDGGYKCGGLLNASFDPFKMSIRAGKLWHLEQELGTISDNEINYQIYDPEDGSTYYLTLTKNERGEIQYYERWHDGEKIALTVKGQLSRF